MKIRIDGYVPDLNSYINAERRNRFIAAKLKKDATQSVALQSGKYSGTVTDFPVDVLFEWHCKPNRGKWLDHDNVAFGKKFILDGLKASGVIPDDNPKFIGDFNDVFVNDTETYVVVEIL